MLVFAIHLAKDSVAATLTDRVNQTRHPQAALGGATLSLCEFGCMNLDCYPVIYFAPTGLGKIHGLEIPGRCAGLFYVALSGRYVTFVPKESLMNNGTVERISMEIETCLKPIDL